MKMRFGKNHKKLAVAVGMALSFSMAYGAAPSEVAFAAAINATVDTGNDTVYKIGSETYDSKDAWIAAINTALAAGTEGDAASLTVTSSLYNELKDTELAVGKNAKLVIQDSSNDGVFTLEGAEGATVQLGASATDLPTISGKLSSLTVDATNVSSSGFTLNGISADTVTVSGATNAVTLGSNNTIGKLEVNSTGTVTAASGSSYSEIAIGNGATLTVDGEGVLAAGSITGESGTLAAKNVTATGDISVKTVTGATSISGKNVTISDAVTASDGMSITADGGTLTLTGGITGPSSEGESASLKADTIKTGNSGLNISGLKIEANTLDVDGTLTVGTDVETVTSETLGGVTNLKAESITGLKNGGSIDLGDNGSVELTGSNVAFGDSGIGNIKAGTVTVDTVDLKTNPNAITASTLVAKDLTVDGDVTSATTGKLQNLTVTGTLTGASSIDLGENGTLDLSGLTTSLSSSGLKDISAGTVSLGADATVDGDVSITANTLNSTKNITVSDSKNFAVKNVSTEGSFIASDATNTVSLGNLTAKEVTGTISADKVTLESVGASSKITADTLTITDNDTSRIKSSLENLKGSNGETNLSVNKVHLTGVTADANLEDIQTALKVATGNDNITIVNDAAQGKAFDDAKEAFGKVETAAAKDKNLALAVKNANEVASADPFRTKLPTASELTALRADQKATVDGTEVKTSKALKQYRESLQAAVDAVEQLGENATDEQLAAAAAAKNTLAGLSKNISSQANSLTQAVQQAGKTAAAPAMTSARTAVAITNVLTNNVVTRTAELRSFASAVDENRPEPSEVWFQFKHTKMDVDGGDVYGTSTVNTNNMQLGYDTKVGKNDYLGAYIGTTSGNADFTGPAKDGRVDLEDSFDFGVYGTHMLPNDQYIDYMIHNSKFDSKYDGISNSYGTKDTGVMVGYGAKIAQNDRLTLNPYIQLAYDKISVDGYTTTAGNVITSDDSDNWTAKIGLNLVDASGVYGGLAYSRGLSGSYNAYINGVAMPTSDNNANVLYLSLGYRANVAKNTILDLSMEKTFLDYQGWTAAGKVNLYF